MDHPPPYLTDEEIKSICEPLTQGAAQVRFLRRIGINAQRKPGGQPLVIRAEFERLRAQEQTATGPVSVPAPTSTADVIALRQHWQNRRNGHGAAARGR